MKLPFELPAPDVGVAPPQWNGQAFEYDGELIQVLEYSENFSGWSDDLTSLHEEVAGDSHPIDIASRSDAISQVKKYLTAEDAVIMEIGCSSGYLIRDLKSHFPKATIVGADVVKEPLYKLSENITGIPLIRFDLLQNPMPPGCVDVLLMINVLEHIENDERALAEAAKLLKPGGILVLEVPAGPLLYDDYDKELHHYRRYSAKDLVRKLTKTGFSVMRKSHLGFLVYPGFAAVKLFNKILKRKNNNESHVKTQATKTSKSSLMKMAFQIESTYMSDLKLPLGIRIMTVAKKVR